MISVWDLGVDPLRLFTQLMGPAWTGACAFDPPGLNCCLFRGTRAVNDSRLHAGKCPNTAPMCGLGVDS